MTDDQRAARLRSRMAARHAADEEDWSEPGPPWHAQLARYVMHATLLAVLAAGLWALSQRPSAPPAPQAAPTAAIVEAQPRAMPSVGSQDGPGATEAQRAPLSAPIPVAPAVEPVPIEPTPYPPSYAPETTGGTRVAGGWEPATAVPVVYHMVAPVEPTPYPKSYQPETPAGGGTRVGGGWGTP